MQWEKRYSKVTQYDYSDTYSVVWLYTSTHKGVTLQKGQNITEQANIKLYKIIILNIWFQILSYKWQKFIQVFVV